MTCSSNDLPGSLKTSTRSVITTGPLAAMLMTRKSILSMHCAPGRVNEEIVLAIGTRGVDWRARDVGVNGVVVEKCGEFAGPDIVGPRRAEPAHYLDRALHLAPPAVDLTPPTSPTSTATVLSPSTRRGTPSTHVVSSI